MTSLPQVGPWELFQRLGLLNRSQVWMGRSLFEPEQLVAVELSSCVEPLNSSAKHELALTHENVPHCLGIGIWPESAALQGLAHYYLARSFARGLHLVALQRSILAANSVMPEAAVLGCVSQLASAIHHAHTKGGSVHGALDPARITIDTDGLVQVSGFVGDPRAFGPALREMAYWSPEHFRGEELTPRSDVFSLGVLLFELATGKRLFKRPSVAETVRAVLEGERPVASRVHRDLSWGLDRILECALAPNPSDRYPTAEVFARALHELESGLDDGQRREHLAAVVKQHGAQEISDLEAAIARFAEVEPGEPPVQRALAAPSEGGR